MKTKGVNAKIDLKKSILEILRDVHGYYECPRDGRGIRLGPLVGYAGEYETAEGKRNLVGDVYADFSKSESYPRITREFAKRMKHKYPRLALDIDVFCGAPLGGYSFAEHLALLFGRRVVKAEKKVVAIDSAALRENTILAFGRHAVCRGERVAIVEDVCNNFKTTRELVTLIERSGAVVTAILCILNRSYPETRREFEAEGTGRTIKVLGVCEAPIPEYRQDDPFVADDIAAGNIVWKPKNESARLEEAMRKAESKE